MLSELDGLYSFLKGERFLFSAYEFRWQNVFNFNGLIRLFRVYCLE